MVFALSVAGVEGIVFEALAAAGVAVALGLRAGVLDRPCPPGSSVAVAAAFDTGWTEDTTGDAVDDALETGMAAV